MLATQAPEVVEAYTPFFTDVRVEEQVYLTQNVVKSFYRSPLPDKSVNLSFTIANITNKLTDLCGN